MKSQLDDRTSNMSSKKVDIRVQRTRKWLQNALRELITEKHYNRISVADITDRAGVARPTFYLHYANKDELLLSQLDELLASLTIEFEQMLTNRPLENEQALVIAVVQQIATQSALFRVILSHQASQLMFERIRQYIVGLMSRLVQTDYIQTTDETLIALVADYMAGAFIHLVEGWLSRDMPYTPEALSHLFLALTIPGVQAILTENQLEDLLSESSIP